MLLYMIGKVQLLLLFISSVGIALLAAISGIPVPYAIPLLYVEVFNNKKKVSQI